MIDTAKAPAQSQASPLPKPSNKQKATTTKPDKPKKSGGGGRLISLFLLVILGGTSGYLYLCLERPDILNRASDSIGSYTDETGQNEQSNQSDYGEPNERIEELERRLDNISKVPHNHDEYGRQIKSLAAELQEMSYRLDKQESKLATSSPPSVALQLQLIDLVLNASGDVASAVNALRDVQSNNPEVLAEEISRLEKIPNREKIIMQIEEIRTLTRKVTTDATAEQKTIGNTIISLFNIRQVTDKKTKTMHKHLNDMELLLLAGRKKDYMNTLATAAKLWRETSTDTSDPNISGLFELLLEYGVPDYRLRLRFGEF